MTLKNFFFLFSTACISLSFGFFIGLWFANFSSVTNIAPLSISSADEKIPVLTLLSIENGILKISKNNEEIRVRINDEIFIATDENIFEIPIETILPMLQKLPAPEGMNFVASKRGSTYWPLDSPRAFILSVKNRVFYKTEIDAIKDGKTRKK